MRWIDQERPHKRTLEVLPPVYGRRRPTRRPLSTANALRIVVGAAFLGVGFGYAAGEAGVRPPEQVKEFVGRILDFSNRGVDWIGTRWQYALEQNSQALRDEQRKIRDDAVINKAGSGLESPTTQRANRQLDKFAPRP